jgi:phosphoribosylformylglycinamidine (FGAM) synthase-like amidotransferase family enzyme
MKSSVITFPGSNCDRDMDVALKNLVSKIKWFGTMTLNYQKVIW